MSGDTNQNEVAYRVLARKYRPSTFEDLIGQAPMVQTLTNAFKLNRIAQAYMLTGVRGVGKTTTARILARALNYEAEGFDGPTIEMPDYGAHCEAIIKSSHIDVIEMDAASHTGINDIREIIDAVKYKPASARYKVYIIDEVHMLSTAAFNGLLKTLEEPPEHVKFIFATTEIRKVPVTVLSRCQRFDLRRIEPETMVNFLKGICEKESVEVGDDALALLARASEGSVRDALSLLDQAIAHGDGGVSADQMRDMMGLADQARVVDLFEHLMAGRIMDALNEIKAQYDVGADPLVILSDLAEFTHLVTIAKVAGGVPSSNALSKIEVDKAEGFAEKLSIRVLSRTWQMLLKGIEEVERANRPIAAADMVLVRIAHVADLPTPDEALQMLKDGEGGTSGAAPKGQTMPNGGSGATALAINTQPQAITDKSIEMASRPKPVLATVNEAPVAVEPDPKPILRISRFEDLVVLAEEKRNLALRGNLLNNVCLISFEDGRMEFSVTPGTSGSFVNELKTSLRDWTGQDWSIALSRSGGEMPLAQQRQEEEAQKSKDAEEDPVVSAFLKEFPGAKIVNITYMDDEEGADVLEPAPEEDDS